MATMMTKNILYLNATKMFKYDVLIKHYMNEFEKYVYNVLRNNKNVAYVYRFKDRTSGVRGYSPADFLVVTRQCTIFLEVKSRRGRLPRSDFRKSQITAARRLNGSNTLYYFLILDSKSNVAYILTYCDVINLIKELTIKNLLTIPWDIMQSYAIYYGMKRYALRYIINCKKQDEGDKP